MDAKEFEKGLNKLTSDQIKKAKDECSYESDYPTLDNPDQEITADNGDTWMEFETHFVNDVGDYIGIYYDKNNKRFTDDGETADEFSMSGYTLNDYQDKLKKLFKPYDIYYDDTSEEILYPAEMSESSLSLYVQAIVGVYALMKMVAK